jgi:uncharacterized membrane protein
MFKRLIAVSLLTLGTLASFWPAAAQTADPSSYYVTDLGLLPGATESYAGNINDSGWVVGGSPWNRTMGVEKSWLWTPNGADLTQGALTQLTPAQAPAGSPASDSCRATDINRDGVMVGQSWAYSKSNPRATCWTAPGAPLDFNTVLLNPGGWTLENATSVSDPGPAGELYVSGIGYHDTAPTTRVGLVWCFSGGVITSITPLQTPPGPADAYANANEMNRLGQMVGSYSNYDLRWETDGQYRDLGTLAGASIMPSGINDAGIVVGRTPGKDRGWVWTPTAATTGELTVLNAPVDNRGDAWAINNTNQVVGRAVFTVNARKTTSTVWHACLWQDGIAYDLNSLKTAGATSVELWQATNINNQGSILASYNSTKGGRAVLLTPQ